MEIDSKKMSVKNLLVVYKFVAVGFVNTAFGLAVIYFSMYFLEMNPILSNLVGYLLGFLLGYALNKNWTFNSNSSGKSGLLVYLVIILAAYLVNVTSVHLCIIVFSINPYLAQLCGMIIYTVMSFMGCKKYVFTG